MKYWIPGWIMKLFWIKSLGCFESVFLNNFFRLRSNGTHSLDVKFNLNTRYLPESIQVHHGDRFNYHMLENTFDIKRRTVLIVHGWRNNGNEEWITKMKNAFLEWVVTLIFSSFTVYWIIILFYFISYSDLMGLFDSLWFKWPHFSVLKMYNKIFRGNSE